MCKKGGGEERKGGENLMGVDVLHVIHMACNHITACAENK